MGQAPPQYSEDGRYWWDGRQWVPVQRPASANRTTLVVVAVVVAALILLCGFGTCAFMLAGSGGPGGGAPPSGDVSGTYQLEKINGHDLPAGGSFHEFVTGGTLKLNGDGTYTLRFSWSSSLGEGRFTGDDGEWTRSGDTVQFAASGENYRYSGRLSGSSILITYDWHRDGNTDQFLFSR